MSSDEFPRITESSQKALALGGVTSRSEYANGDEREEMGAAGGTVQPAASVRVCSGNVGGSSERHVGSRAPWRHCGSVEPRAPRKNTNRGDGRNRRVASDGLAAGHLRVVVLAFRF